MTIEIVIFLATFGMCCLSFYLACQFKEISDILFTVFYLVGMSLVYLTFVSVHVLATAYADSEIVTTFTRSLMTWGLGVIPTLNLIIGVLYWLMVGKKTLEKGDITK